MTTGGASGSEAVGGDPAKDGVHPGDELAEPERFGDVSGGAEFETEDDVELAVDGAHHEDRHLRDGPQPAADVDAVHAGEQHVEEHDVGTVLLEATDPLGAVLGQDHVEALAAQPGGEGLAVGLLVLHDEDLDGCMLRRHRRLLPRTRYGGQVNAGRSEGNPRVTSGGNRRTPWSATGRRPGVRGRRRPGGRARRRRARARGWLRRWPPPHQAVRARPGPRCRRRRSRTW